MRTPPALPRTPRTVIQSRHKWSVSTSRRRRSRTSAASRCADTALFSPAASQSPISLGMVRCLATAGQVRDRLLVLLTVPRSLLAGVALVRGSVAVIPALTRLVPATQDKLFICEYSLKYFKSWQNWAKHKADPANEPGRLKRPPGQVLRSEPGPAPRKP
jgi:hypothetical protein